MQASINKQLLNRLEPRKRPFEVRDTRLKGFLVRVQPTGRMSYVCEYGRGRRLTLGKVGVLKPAQARDLALAHLADAAKGNDPKATRLRQRPITFDRYLDDVYRDIADTRHRDGYVTITRLRGRFDFLCRTPLDEIKPMSVEKWMSMRTKEGIKRTTINRDIAELKSALSTAVEIGLLENNPLKGLRPFRSDNLGRNRYLSPNEESALLEALRRRDKRKRDARQSANGWREERGRPLYAEVTSAMYPDHLTAIVMLAMHTGLRRGEIFALTWDDIDFSAKVLTVRGASAKSGKTRHVPLNEHAFKTIKQWRQQRPDDMGLAFPGKNGCRLYDIKSAWTALLAEAGIKDFRFHDLRHHFASRLVMAGVDLNVVRELLGHSDFKMTLRYAHLVLMPEQKRAYLPLT